jgi:hypothetical protein
VVGKRTPGIVTPNHVFVTGEPDRLARRWPLRLIAIKSSPKYGAGPSGTYSVSGDWLEVIAADGRYKSATIADSTPEEVAERLLRELYARPGGAIDD